MTNEEFRTATTAEFLRRQMDYLERPRSDVPHLASPVPSAYGQAVRQGMSTEAHAGLGLSILGAGTIGRAAGAPPVTHSTAVLNRATEAATQAERARCAKVCEDEAVDGTVSQEDAAYNTALEHAAAAIRADTKREPESDPK